MFRLFLKLTQFWHTPACLPISINLSAAVLKRKSNNSFSWVWDGLCSPVSHDGHTNNRLREVVMIADGRKSLWVPCSMLWLSVTFLIKRWEKCLYTGAEVSVNRAKAENREFNRSLNHISEIHLASFKTVFDYETIIATLSVMRR